MHKEKAKINTCTRLSIYSLIDVRRYAYASGIFIPKKMTQSNLTKNYLYNLALVHKQAVLPVEKSFQSRFTNREHESGTKEPLLVPVSRPGLKVFSPGWSPPDLALWGGPLVPVGITNLD